MTNEGCTCPRLLFRVDPVSQESPRGYLCRAAHEHSYTGPFSILRLADFIKEIPEGAKGIERLAHVLRLEPEEWQALSYRKAGSRKGFKPRMFCGKSISYHDLNYGCPRLCPACLRERPIWWAVWDLRLVTACPVHRCLLLNQCPGCKKKLRWQRPAVYRCRCGIDFRNLAAEQADDDLLAINTLIYRAAAFPVSDDVVHDLAGYRFPKQVFKLRLGTLLTLILLANSIKKNGSPCNKQNVETKNLATSAEMGRAAVAVLRDWPAPLHDAFKSMLPPDIHNPATLKFNKVFGNLYYYLFHDLPRREYGFLIKVFEIVIIEGWKGLIRGSHCRPWLFFDQRAAKITLDDCI